MSGRKAGRTEQPGRKQGESAQRKHHSVEHAHRDAKHETRGHQIPLKRAANENESKARAEAMTRLESIVQSVAEPLGLEVVEVEWKGSGRNPLLRIYIDKESGVSHEDCELVSRGVSSVLDTEDPIPGAYELEVSSPGVERKLKKASDWRRFLGKKAKVVLKRQPEGDPAEHYFEGTISGLEDANGEQNITVETANGRRITFALSLVERANLKFEW